MTEEQRTAATASAAEAQRLQSAPDQASGLEAQIEALRETVATLERQIARAGREQLKANALAETQAERMGAALGALRAADERHAAEVAELRERVATAHATARLELARSLLPALDGIDAALRAGPDVLTLADAEPEPEPEPRRGWLTAWLSPAPSMSEADTQRLHAPEQRVQALREAIDSWLVGLGFVRERMLTALAETGVTPIAAEGQPFDPRHHIAVEVVAADGLPAGTVAREIRRGYMAGTRVLRHAEVAVAGQQNGESHQ